MKYRVQKVVPLPEELTPMAGGGCKVKFWEVDKPTDVDAFVQRDRCDYKVHDSNGNFFWLARFEPRKRYNDNAY